MHRIRSLEWGRPLALVLPLVLGCAVGIHEAPLPGDPMPIRDMAPVYSAESSTGIDGKVGWGKGTLFAIPMVPIYITGDDNIEVARRIGQAVDHAGLPRATRPEGAARLDYHVERFWFQNYTWFFPILVPTWGNAEIRVTVSDLSGNEVWSRAFTASGRTFNFFNGFSIAANEALDQILVQMRDEFRSREFARTLTEASTPGSTP
ncbi:MAG: hypothetical protein ACQGVC_07865 [Myxococcota bacterium]